MIINILGTLYTVVYKTEEEDSYLETCSGYCDYYAKNIVIDKNCTKETKRSCKNLQENLKRIIIHELTHAYFYESGLQNYSSDEVLVDWIAIQLSKISSSFIDIFNNQGEENND